MKKILFCSITAVASLLITSCNETGKQTPSTIDTTAPDSAFTPKAITLVPSNVSGAYNFLVDKDTAQAMIDRFTAIFQRDIAQTYPIMNNFVNSSWIDTSIIKSLSRLINSSTSTYNGVSIITAVRLGSKKSFIIIAPTRPSKSDTTMHEEVWGKVIKPSTTNRQDLEYDQERGKADRLIKRFRSEYKKQRDLANTSTNRQLDSLSNRVWIDKIVFQYLSDLDSIDGVRIYHAAYNWKNPKIINYQKHDFQSTVLLVPTKKNGGNHDDDWTIAREKYALQPGGGGAYNHGQLCPTKCND